MLKCILYTKFRDIYLIIETTKHDALKRSDQRVRAGESNAWDRLDKL